MSLRALFIINILAIVFFVQVTGDCDGDPNAEPGCKSSFCRQRCDLVTVVDCDRACVEGGCRCVGNYKYDTNLNKCVPPEQCSTRILHPGK